MTKTIRDLINAADNVRFATDAGTLAHKQMQFALSNPDLMAKIATVPGLSDFFGSNSRPEVAIAGTIRKHFISRRIDRLVIDDTNKIIKVLDYKTDADHQAFRSKYITQLNEYRDLLAHIYPKYTIELYILWLHDWRLERI